MAKRTGRAAYSIQLPATSANLGPAFDAAALAFNLFLKVSARPADEFSIVASGRDAEICERVENHLILTTYRDVLQAQGKKILPVALRIDNQIPIGKGCGSSATARLAGIALAVHFGKLGWKDNRIVGEASRLEHHPDNAAACWFGGVAVARMLGDDDAEVARIVPKGKWPLLLAIPPAALSTEKARRVLPEKYSRADAVTNIQNSMLLVSAFVQGRPELLGPSLNDRIHQPYRAALCPLLPALQELHEEDVLGAVLSGAGPSVLMFLHPKAKVEKVKIRVANYLREQNLEAELISTMIAPRGMKKT